MLPTWPILSIIITRVIISLPSPPITKKTIELGAKYSPDSVCLPFKYNLGNFIEALEKGANILFTAGGGCRYRYYAEVTETILKDLNYEFEFFNLITDGKLKITKVYKEFKKLNPSLSFFFFIHQLLYTLIFIWNMDKIDKTIELILGKKAFKEINDLNLSINDYKTISMAIMATITGQTLEEFETRFQQATNE